MPVDANKYMPLFLAEIDEQLSMLDEQIACLENDNIENKKITEILRIIHTIKGDSAAMGFDGIALFSHNIEELLSMIKDGFLPLEEDLYTVIIDSVDCLKKGLLALKKTQKEPKIPVEISLLLEKIISDRNNACIYTSNYLETRKKASQMENLQMEKPPSIMNIIMELLMNVHRLENANREIDSGEIHSIILDLRETAQKLQMHLSSPARIKLSEIFGAFPQIVATIADKEQKEVVLSIDVGELEIDSRAVGKIISPIIQIIRNAISHGIESPAERKKAGKPQYGHISIEASYDENLLKISISNDGRSIDVDMVRSIAAKLGICQEEELRKMPEEQVMQLIFDPGFTTCSKVGKMSGRGIGLYAAMRGVESIGGKIEILNNPHKGTTFMISIPQNID